MNDSLGKECISVVVPVYNVETYLEKCIQSILGNTYKNIELICVNDGSTDKSPLILRRFAAQDHRIKIINQNNQGVQTARNNGIKAATGKYIAFIDSDDWIHSYYFQTLLNCMENRKADMVVCGCRKFVEGENIQEDVIKNISFYKLTDGQMAKSDIPRHMVWGRLFKRDIINDKWFVPEVKFGEDTLFNMSVVAGLKTPSIYVTDVPLYYYLQRRNSLAKTTTYQKNVHFAEWVIQNWDQIDKGPWAWILFVQGVKMTLSYRYGAILHMDSTNVLVAKRILYTLKMMLIRNHQIPFNIKLIHLIMIQFPTLYRWFRVKDDPTMLQWESNAKKLRILPK